MKHHIEAKLREALSPDALHVVDDSARHAGHAGSRPDGGTHFQVSVVSHRFEGLSRVARHRLVFDILKDEMQSHVHALNIVARTPEEVNR